MYSYKKLTPSILILLIVGIAVIIHNITYHSPIIHVPTEVIDPVVVYDTIVVDNNSLINSIETTLETADGAIDGMINDQKNTERTILFLNRTVNEEKYIIDSLKLEISLKDSVINKNQESIDLLSEDLKTLQFKYNNTENILERYISEYSVLLNKIEYLQNNLEECYSESKYLDSLILTNKRLTKNYINQSNEY